MKDVRVFPEWIPRGIVPENSEGFFPEDLLEHSATSLAEVSFQPLEQMDFFGPITGHPKPTQELTEKRTFSPVSRCLQGPAGIAHLVFDSYCFLQSRHRPTRPER
jgi:hypothetical protein